MATEKLAEGIRKFHSDVRTPAGLRLFWSRIVVYHSGIVMKEITGDGGQRARGAFSGLQLHYLLLPSSDVPEVDALVSIDQYRMESWGGS
jgi:hypothetical protein